MEKPLSVRYESENLAINEDAFDIAEFQMYVSDWTFWKARCGLAATLNISVGMLEVLVWGQILHQLGLWDPQKPRDLPSKIQVTLRDLQDSPKALELGPNRVFQSNMFGRQAEQEPNDNDPFSDDR